MNALSRSVTAPDVAMTSTSPPVTGVLTPALTTICESEAESTAGASAPARLTRSTPAAPPSRRWPEMVTSVPTWPTAGSTDVMRLSGSTSNASWRVTRAPVLDWMVTSTVVGLAKPEVAAAHDPEASSPRRTTTAALLCDTTWAETLPNKTWLTAVPPPSRDEPVRRTNVPRWPDVGRTALMAPGVR